MAQDLHWHIGTIWHRPGLGSGCGRQPVASRVCTVHGRPRPGASCSARSGSRWCDRTHRPRRRHSPDGKSEREREREWERAFYVAHTTFCTHHAAPGRRWEADLLCVLVLQLIELVRQIAVTSHCRTLPGNLRPRAPSLRSCSGAPLPALNSRRRCSDFAV